MRRPQNGNTDPNDIAQTHSLTRKTLQLDNSNAAKLSQIKLYVHVLDHFIETFGLLGKLGLVYERIALHFG